STAGGILGMLLGIVGVRVFRATASGDLAPSYISFDMDYRVLIYLVAITVGTGILFGLAPALRLSKLDINAVLKEGARRASLGMRGQRLSTVFSIAETALAFVLLVGAGLMIRSFLNMALTPIGVRTDHLMSMDIALRAKKYPTEASQISFHRQLATRLEGLPGVEKVAMASNLPGDGWTSFNYEIEGAPPIDPRRQPRTGAVIVS